MIYLLGFLIMSVPAAVFTALAYLVVGPGDFWSGAICGGLSWFASATIIEKGIRG